MAEDDKKRIETQKRNLGPEGLTEKGLSLKKAMEYNEV